MMRLAHFILFFLIFQTSIVIAQESYVLQSESFENVWSTIDKEHFDPLKNGVIWGSAYVRYKPEILSVRDNEAFLEVANRMLFELGQSHALVASEEMLKRSMPTLFSTGTVGVDVRWLNEKAIITKIRDTYPGDSAGLRVGNQILKGSSLMFEVTQAAISK